MCQYDGVIDHLKTEESGFHRLRRDRGDCSNILPMHTLAPKCQRRRWRALTALGGWGIHQWPYSGMIASVALGDSYHSFESGDLARERVPPTIVGTRTDRDKGARMIGVLE